MLKRDRGGRIGYACTKCGTEGCKLWREWNTFLSHQDLYCVRCACALRPGKVAPEDVDAGGYHELVYRPKGGEPYSLGPSDQLNGLAPAVPTVDGTTFWGYTSVPPAAVAWWRALPTQPLAVPAPTPPVPEEAPADRVRQDTATIFGAG